MFEETDYATPLSHIERLNPAYRSRMKENTLLLCAGLFVACLFIADTTAVKLYSYSLCGVDFFVPASTFAFSLTFIATDVVCEVTGGRSLANKIVLTALTLRVFELLYYRAVIGDDGGRLPFIGLSPLWTPAKQEHLVFVLGAGAHFALAGICATFVSFMVDTYVFSKLRQLWLRRNLYWLRNATVTMLAQIINSLIFVTIAFGASMTLTQIGLTAIGQIALKICLAWLDTPLALILRNYGQGRKYWYACWKRDFYLG